MYIQFFQEMSSLTHLAMGTIFLVKYLPRSLRVRYVINNLLCLVIVKYGVISLGLYISTRLRLVTLLTSLMKYLVILEKWFPLQGKLAQSVKTFYVRILCFKNIIERRKRRQNKNRPINLPQSNNIVHILRVHHLTLNFIIHGKYISTLYLYTYIHTYIHTHL